MVCFYLEPSNVITNCIFYRASYPLVATNPPPYIPPNKHVIPVYLPVLVIAVCVWVGVIASRIHQQEYFIFTTSCKQDSCDRRLIMMYSPMLVSMLSTSMSTLSQGIVWRTSRKKECKRF